MTGECEFADLFDTCTHPAVVAVRWRHWGWVNYCHKHYVEMVGNKKDVLMIKNVNGVVQ